LSLSMPDLIAISRESGCLFGENQVLLMWMTKHSFFYIVKDGVGLSISYDEKKKPDR
jgi:hypothetical protein